MSSVVVIGDAMVDVVVRPTGPPAAGSDRTSTITWRQGGAATTTAVQLAGLGVDVTLIGRVGDDQAGRWLADSLAAAGVRPRLTVDPAQPTGTVVALVTADERDMYTDRGASAALSVEDLAEGWLDDVDHVHISGYTLLSAQTRSAGRSALAQAAAAGVAVSVDPASAVPLQQIGARVFLSWLPAATLLTPNAAEARVLTGHDDPTQAAIALAEQTGEAVVTCGARGAVWSDGIAVVRRAAPAPTADVDPVGAGDAFTAGLLAARLQGADPAAQLVAGNLAATVRSGPAAPSPTPAPAAPTGTAG